MLRRQVGGVWQNGLAIPTIYGAAIPDEDAPMVARITGIFKERTVGSIRLSTTDDSAATGVLLGIYEPDETVASVSAASKSTDACNWARVGLHESSPTVSRVATIMSP